MMQPTALQLLCYHSPGFALVIYFPQPFWVIALNQYLTSSKEWNFINCRPATPFVHSVSVYWFSKLESHWLFQIPSAFQRVFQLGASEILESPCSFYWEMRRYMAHLDRQLPMLITHLFIDWRTRVPPNLQYLPTCIWSVGTRQQKNILL